MANDITFDVREFFRRIVRVLFEGIAVAVAAFLIPGKKMDAKEIILIGVTAAATFSMLDLLSPSMGSSVRNGAGLSIGVGLTGGLPTAPH